MNQHPDEQETKRRREAAELVDLPLAHARGYVSTRMPEPNPTPSTEPLWYRNAVIYQAHVRSFYDSDGNGIGDFRGLTQKLDYLQDRRDFGGVVAAVLPVATAR